MGWWTVHQSGQEILQGDEPYDIMGDALEQIAQVYERDLNRKPTLIEIIQTVQATLNSGAEDYFSEGVEAQIVKLIPKTKKVKSYQYQVGDFFIVPFHGKGYAYGRILSDLRFPEMGMLVGIYAKVSKRPLAPQQLVGNKFISSPFYYGGEGWKSGRWKIIGNMPVSSDEFTYPKHKLGDNDSGWRIRDKDRIYKATAEEVIDLDYATLWSTKAVEQRIYDYLEGKTTKEKSS